MAVEGTLDLFQLPEILQVVSQQRKTGILTVQGTDDIVAVSFLDGEIVAADSLTETTEDGVGEVLIAQGLLAASALREMTARSAQGGTRLGDLLVSDGHVDRSQFLAALRDHTLNLLMALLGWRNGEFKFYGGDEVSYEEGFRPIGVDELLLRSIEQGEEREREALPDPTSRLRPEETDKPVRVRPVDELGDQPTPTVGEDAVWVSPEEERVLRSVGPRLTVEQVAQEAGMPLDRTRYVLYRLSRAGLVAPAPEVPVEAAPPASPPPDEPSAPALEAGPALDLPEVQTPVDAPAPAPIPAKVPAQARTPSPASAPVARRARPAARRSKVVTGMRGLPITTLLAVVLAAVVVGASVLTPVSLLRPFPWLTGERAEADSTRAEAQRLKIDRAAKTFFLLEGRFPDRLEDLIARGLLQSDDLIDPRGRILSYRPREASYEVGPLAAGDEGSSGSGGREGIVGDFLLDPDFLPPPADAGSAEAPLVLLD
ncbi:MAG: DUF4388 domain-containing protein [Acidobacteriota bacterium]|jgi:hypothetical protein